jgi:hypothetical protein
MTVAVWFPAVSQPRAFVSVQLLPDRTCGAGQLVAANADKAAKKTLIPIRKKARRFMNPPTCFLNSGLGL